MLHCDDSCFLIPCGLDSEPLFQVVGSTSFVAGPCFWETGLASIHQLHYKRCVLNTCQSEVKPSASKRAHVHDLFDMPYCIGRDIANAHDCYMSAPKLWLLCGAVASYIARHVNAMGRLVLSTNPIKLSAAQMPVK